MTLYGGLITKRALCYTIDGKLLLAPCGNDIRIYSAASGDHLTTLKGHGAEVTAVVQDPSSDKVVLSSSLDGTLRQWDIQEGRTLRNWQIGAAVESMVYSKPTGLAYVSIHHKGGQSGRVQAYLLATGEEQQGRIKTSKAAQLVISPTGTHVAAIDKNSLFVWAAGSITASGRAKPLNLSHTKAYTCAAFDASDSMIAAGDVTGRILIWHNFPAALQEWSNGTAAGSVAAAMAIDPGSYAAGGVGAPVRLPACTTVHWHAHAVGAVCFSVDGSYLMSGGQEGVLVQWSVPTNKRTYLPRLGGPLKGIFTSRADPAKLFVSHSDNTVRLINTATMSVQLSIHGLRPAPPPAALAAAGYGTCCSSGSSSPAGVVLQPGSGTLVLPVDPASLQFFDISRDRHIARLQVSSRNPVSLTEAATNHLSAAAAGQVATAVPLQPAVVLVAFTKDGLGLITVDVRPATAAYGATAAEATLRFWDRITGSHTAGAAAPYTLNTSADCPHKGQVTGLAAHPWQDMAVTTGTEGEFKVWMRAAKASRKSAAAADGSSSSVEQLGHWRFSSVGGYKGLGLSCCSFSHDGSLLAVAAGATATLWDPYDNVLITSLCCPPGVNSNGGNLRQLVFMKNSPHLVGLVGGGDCSAALAAAGVQATADQQQQSRQQRHRQQQLLAAVQNSWGNGVVVWDLLNGSLKWHCSLPVCSLAADPVSPVFAVGVPAVLGAAVTGKQGEPAQEPQQQQQQQPPSNKQQKDVQQQQQQAESRQGLVMVFSPDDPKPLLACSVPGSNPSSLIFMPSSSSRKMVAVGKQPARMSSLMLLTEDRRYTRLITEDDQESATEDQQQSVGSDARAAVEAELAAEGKGSAFEAMFGKPEQSAGVRGGARERASAAEEAAAVTAAVAQLFDAPSHVLPAPTTLCPTLLELVIGVGRR